MVPSSNKNAPNHCPSTFYFRLKIKLRYIDLVRFFENGTKLKIPSEISPTLKGHCYMFTSYHLDFLKAEEQCNQVEGYLADILTKGPSICYFMTFAEGGGGARGVRNW